MGGPPAQLNNRLATSQLGPSTSADARVHAGKGVAPPRHARGGDNWDVGAVNPDDPTQLAQKIADLLSYHAEIGSNVRVPLLAREAGSLSLPLHGAIEIAPVAFANEPINMRATPRYRSLSAVVLNFALLPDARRRLGSRQLVGSSKEGASSRLRSQIRSFSADAGWATLPRHESLIGEATRVRPRTSRARLSFSIPDGKMWFCASCATFSCNEN